MQGGKREKKRRKERVREKDRNVEKRVHDGKGYVKVRRGNERARGKKWGEFVKTRKPCTKGANRQLRKKAKRKGVSKPKATRKKPARSKKGK